MLAAVSLPVPVIWSDDCLRHEPAGEVWLGLWETGTEVPQRATVLLDALTAAGVAGTDAVPHGDDALNGIAYFSMEFGLNESLPIYAGGLGTQTAMGEAAAGHVKIVAEYHSNVEHNKAAAWDAAYRKQAPKENPDFYYLRGKIMFDMLVAAMKKAGTDDPVKVAYALEGMKMKGDMGPLEMRKTDHQLIQPLYVFTLEKSAALGGPKAAKIEMEHSGLAPVTDARIEAQDTATPTTCKMQRP